MNTNTAYEGFCTRCNQRLIAYYLFAHAKTRKDMRDGTFMSIKADCPGCVTSKILQTRGTVKWHRKMTGEEVDKLLQKEMEGGIQIDFDAAEKQLKKEEENDKWIEANDRRIAEILAWRAKTEGGTQKYTH